MGLAHFVVLDLLAKLELAVLSGSNFALPRKPEKKFEKKLKIKYCSYAGKLALPVLH